MIGADEFEWDEAKREANLSRHKADFADIARLDWETALVLRDDRKDYGEARFLVMGRIDYRLHVAVITPRSDRFRVISRVRPIDERRPGLAHDPENPEWTEEMFDRARPARDTPEFRRLARPGRPPLPASARKRRVTLHLDPDVIEALKADGRGWQTRANARLREALGLDPS
ncbi:MAG: BrnA antitoxin family protein [Pseudomonadota bacterium]